LGIYFFLVEVQDFDVNNFLLDQGCWRGGGGARDASHLDHCLPQVSDVVYEFAIGYRTLLRGMMNCDEL
jgi:hypothetical protein